MAPAKPTRVTFDQTHASRSLTLAATVLAAAMLWVAESSQAASVADAAKTSLGPKGPAFYSPPRPLPAGRAGKLIWARPIGAPKGARAWKILYRSTLHDGKAVAVSGLVIAPARKPPRGGRRVVAWAHGTLGGARNCAPSIPGNPARNLASYYTYRSPYPIDVGVPALTRFLRAGYVVTATDYQGLGTPGVHQYVVGSTEARNVLDSVKAAKQIPAAGAGNDVAVLGWSQGGGAAIFAGQEAAATYGKPLRVRGIAALAPAADIGPEFAGQTPPGPSSPSSPSHDAVLALNVFRGLAAAYPRLSTDTVVAAPGRPALAALDVECTIHVADVLQELGTDPATMFIRPVPPDWQRRLDENTAGNETTVAPVLVLQGTADTVVNPNGSTQYVRRACGFSRPVEYSVYPGATHQTIPFVSQSEYVRWIADRFARKRARSSCPP
jgi:alpha-beta hydrolase superfamily lysophospholipase